MSAQTTNPFTVRAGGFTGPLDLLLDLIEKRKMHIGEVSLAAVADDFLNYLRALREFPVAEAANFVTVAATLLLIKSRSLLPTLELTDEESGSVEELERRLALYKRYRALAKIILGTFGRTVLFARSYHPEETPIFVPPEGISAASVLAAARDLVVNFPRPTKLPERAVAPTISLEEMIDRLTARIMDGIRMSFREFTSKNGTSRVDTIVGFLALLELVKQGILHVEQEKNFEDIHMEHAQVNLPHYGA